MSFEEEYRLRLLKKAHSTLNSKPPDEVLEAQEVIAEFSKKQEHAKFVVAQASTKHCPSLCCPLCFFQRGVTVHLKPTPSNNDIDLFRCPSCEHIYGQEA
jgi:hypothetical protein